MHLKVSHVVGASASKLRLMETWELEPGVLVRKSCGEAGKFGYRIARNGLWQSICREGKVPGSDRASPT